MTGFTAEITPVALGSQLDRALAVAIGGVNPSDSTYGAAGDGVTVDTAAVQAAMAAAVAANSYVTFGPGTYLVNSSLTFNTPVVMQPGAVLKTSANANLVFNKALLAGVYQVFNLSGTSVVTLDPAHNSVGYAEWWGAVPGGPDCLAAISAAFVACPVVQLMQADYYISNTLKLNTAHRTLQGFSRHWGQIGDSTRIIVTAGNKDVIQIGPDTLPGGGFNAFTNEIRLKSMSVTRSVVPAGVATLTSCPAGIRNQFTAYCRISDVWSTESSIAFLFSGTNNTKVEDCYAFRSVTGSNLAADPAIGYLYDGTANIGAAGGNASLYIHECNMTVGGAPSLTQSVGFYGYHGYTDTFVEKLETAQCMYGEYLDGSGAGPQGTQDFHSVGCVYDQCLVAGVYKTGGGTGTMTEHRGLYAAGAVSGSWMAPVYLNNEAGTSIFIGGTLLCGLNANDKGIYAVNSTGFIFKGAGIRECYNPVVLSGCSNFEVDVACNNPTVGTASAAVAISGTNTVGKISPSVKGGAGVFGYGVNLGGAANSRIAVDTSKIDPAALNGGVANTLVSNAVQVTADGAFNTNNYAMGRIN